MNSRFEILTAFVASLILANNATAQSIEHVSEMSRPGVVELRVIGSDASGRTTLTVPGSGFAVHSDDILQQTFLVTAAHVLGPPDKWLQNRDGTPDRKIELRTQNDDGQLVLINDHATVIWEDKTDDFAIIAIPKSSLKILPVGSSAHLMKTMPVAVVGFPAERGFRGRIIHVWETDLPGNKMELDGIAEGGQSGGPVIDATGRVVGIISENTNRQHPRFHSVVIISVAVEALNVYLRKRGRPEASFQDAGHGNQGFSIASRSGNITGSVQGNSGDLATGKNDMRTMSEGAMKVWGRRQ
jgi:S1-C subfamily serine protease